MTAEDRCSSISSQIHEPQFATASRVSSWVLVEQPGPWGYDATRRNRMPRAVARALRAKARSHHVRLVLIRRPGRSEASGSHSFFAHTGRRHRLLQHAYLPGGPSDLLELDWSPILKARPVETGETEDRPLFLVCTNGARDPCCAERGRPLAGALEVTFGERVWECSHIGGDRFAGNLVCFPHGVYFGRVTPDDATRIALGYAEGSLDLDHFRGRSCYDFATQAAEHFVRQETGLRGIEEVVLIRRAPVSRGRLETEFEVPGGTVTVSLQVRRSPEPRRLTCHGAADQHPLIFELVSLTRSRRRGG